MTNIATKFKFQTWTVNLQQVDFDVY